VILNLGSIEPLGYDVAILGVQQRSSDFSNPFLLSVILGKNGVQQQKLANLRKGLVYEEPLP